jgi:hypothetical protein
MPTIDYDPSVEEQVTAYFKAQNWPAPDIEKCVKIGKGLGVTMCYCYPWAPKHTLIAVAIYSAYVIFIDDQGGEFMDALDIFQRRFLLSQKNQDHPVLQSLAEFLPTFEDSYGPYACDMIFKATMEFVRTCIVEFQYDGKLVPPQSAPNFPRYLRLKTGICEPYTHFLYPESIYPEKSYLGIYIYVIPDLMDYINYTNDIMSFYKESIVSTEEFNFIFNYARSHNMAPFQALPTICEKALQCRQRIHKTLAAEPKMLQDTEEFMQRFIAFHITNPRYHLRDFDIYDANGVNVQTFFPSEVDKLRSDKLIPNGLLQGPVTISV